MAREIRRRLVSDKQSEDSPRRHSDTILTNSELQTLTSSGVLSPPKLPSRLRTWVSSRYQLHPGTITMLNFCNFPFLVSIWMYGNQ